MRIFDRGWIIALADRLPARVTWFLCIGLRLLVQPAMATERALELIQPPVCSAATAGFVPNCTVTPLGNGHNEVKVDLTAETAPVEIAGYKVITENYNGNYLTPVIEAMPGDTVAAQLINILAPRVHDGSAHGDADLNPTNLHYFHGGIVSPNNPRPHVELGNGDNIYVHLKAGLDSQGNPSSCDFKVPIPGDHTLDARVLEGTGYIDHPLGLNWYHSHLHGISSDQVMGGMSGLLSVGESTANVKAACREDSRDNSKCLNNVERDTVALKSVTKVRYVLLRDLPLREISKRPEEADNATAQWAPGDRDFPVGTRCGVWKQDGSGFDYDNPKLRLGFCQREPKLAWLFTLNGQRFPTISVAGGQNVLIRMGNLSSNIGYWLELYNEADGTPLPLTLLSLDGVVPARPAPENAGKPAEAVKVDNLLLMPASRAEIYVRNDDKPHTAPQVFILRTKGLQNIGNDEWPEIQLARIVLEPNVVASSIMVAQNAPVATAPLAPAKAAIIEKAILPEGCVRDLDPTVHEYRRVTFIPEGRTSDGMQTDWSVLTEIVRPPEGSGLLDEGDPKMVPANPTETTIDLDANGVPTGVPFEDYVGADGLVDWTKTNPKHVCIEIDHGAHEGSHKQLWVLFNATATLHNFHIHQMKFRLATQKELEEHHIAPPAQSHTCDQASNCSQPDYNFYDDQSSSTIDSVCKSTATAPPRCLLWHDTIPLPPFEKVFIVMSFDAKQQIGRFVFHCHILKHEDGGLMAPIEVWEPNAASALQ
jgi:FtsP/CotA-like multicopper oxidase with cupredoxin domain